MKRITIKVSESDLNLIERLKFATGWSRDKVISHAVQTLGASLPPPTEPLVQVDEDKLKKIWDFVNENEDLPPEEFERRISNFMDGLGPARRKRRKL